MNLPLRNFSNVVSWRVGLLFRDQEQEPLKHFIARKTGQRHVEEESVEDRGWDQLHGIRDQVESGYEDHDMGYQSGQTRFPHVHYPKKRLNSSEKRHGCLTVESVAAKVDLHFVNMTLRDPLLNIGQGSQMKG